MQVAAKKLCSLNVCDGTGDVTKQGLRGRFVELLQFIRNAFKATTLRIARLEGRPVRREEIAIDDDAFLHVSQCPPFLLDHLRVGFLQHRFQPRCVCAADRGLESLDVLDQSREVL